MILLFAILASLAVGIVLGVFLTLWQQEAEQREKFLPPTWTPSPPEGWWP